MNERSEQAPPKKPRRIVRLLNWVVPLRETATLGREFGKTTSAIGAAVQQLKERFRQAASQDADPPVPVPVPDGEAGRLVALRGRVTWGCGLLLLCGSAWVVGVWLAATSPALMHTLQAVLGVLLLIVSGMHLGIQGSVLWHSVQRGRWVPAREVLVTPSLWLPF